MVVGRATLILGMACLQVATAAGQRLLPPPDRLPLPAFDLAQIGGPAVPTATAAGRVRSADLAGKILVLDLWSPGCVPCGPMHESLTDIAPQLADSGVTVLSIGILEDSAAAMTWVQAHGGAPFPIALITRDLFQALEIYSIPRLIVADAAGRRAFDGHPLSARSSLFRAIPPLLAERDGREMPRDPNRLN